MWLVVIIDLAQRESSLKCYSVKSYRQVILFRQEMLKTMATKSCLLGDKGEIGKDN